MTVRHLPLTTREARVGDRLFPWACRAATFVPLLVLGWLLGTVLLDGAARLSGSFLWNPDSVLSASRAGLGPALMGSLALMVLTAGISLPLGVGAALYLEEYGRTSRLANTLEVAINNLAGVPSILYGMLGLGVFVRWIGLGESLIAGAATLALLVLPIVIAASREALRTVRDTLREAALGLGATRWQTLRHVVLPLALPGIFTGAILSVSRAIGETAPLVVVGAAAYIAVAPDGLDSDYTALPMQIFSWTSNPKPEFLVNASAGIVVLMGTLLTLNLFAILLRNHTQRRST
jgi:phosphate transport system permease protein